MNYAQRMKQSQEERNKHQAQLEAKHFVFPNLISRAKLDLLYQIAYDYGHANGWNEIEICYDDFVTLVK